MVLPLIIGGAALAGAGIAGSYISGAMSKTAAPDPYQQDWTNYQYGYDPKFDWTQANNDYQQQQGARAQQQELAQRLALMSSGQGGPSVAEQQMRAGQAQAMAQGQALAASARGGPGAAVAAQRAAQQQQALGSLATNREAGMLRAREQQVATEQLGGVLSGMRGGDLAARQGSQGQVFGEQDREMQAARYRQEGGMAFEQARQQGHQWAADRAYAAEEAAKERRRALFGALTGAGASMGAYGAMGGGGR